MPSQAGSIRGSADPEGRSGGSGPRPPVHAWGVLDRDRRLAAIAAVGLFATMFLPWYQQNAVVGAAKAAPLVSRNLDAFAVFSFVEAAVLLVALAVLFLLFMRAEGRNFRLPGGDGAVVLAAGLWSALLLVLRLFDKPGVTQHGVAANVGVQWGIFFALAAAGLLAYAGSRMRAAQRPEPPLVRRSEEPRRREEAVEPEWGRPPREHHSPVTASEDAATVVISRRDGTSRAVPVPASERRRYPPAPPATAAGRAPRRPGSTRSSAEQLSLEDAEPDDSRG
ncbi:MAG: hypothetical protein ACHQE6_00975 [Solirubrobacterales bacterium]